MKPFAHLASLSWVRRQKNHRCRRRQSSCLMAPIDPSLKPLASDRSLNLNIPPEPSPGVPPWMAQTLPSAPLILVPLNRSAGLLFP